MDVYFKIGQEVGIFLVNLKGGPQNFDNLINA